MEGSSIESQAKSILGPLAAKKVEWQTTPKDRKKEILREIGDRLADWGFTYQWAKADCAARKVLEVDEGTEVVCNANLAHSFIVSKAVSLLIASLDGNPVPKVDFLKEFQVETSSSAYVTDVDPLTKIKVILFAESDSRSQFYREGLKTELCVILGAGNLSFLGVLDVLYHCFVEGRVCVLKHHPVQLAAKPFLEHMFDPLIRGGFLTSIEAGMELTQALITHELTECVHLTGGIKTHDAIVFGTENQAANKAANKILLKAKLTSELGAVTPFIVVPSGGGRTDEWTDEAIGKYAAYCRDGLIGNVSCTCLACKVIILPADFPDFSDRFVAVFKRLVSEVKLEHAWYPGIRDRYERWLQAQAVNGLKVDVFFDAPRKRIGDAPDKEYLPFAVADYGTLKPEDFGRLAAVYKDPSWTREEPFAPVCGVVRIAGATAEEYADNAFRFADEHLWGNLSCAVFCPDSARPAAVQRIADGRLNYGTVALNLPTQLSFNPAGFWGGPRGRNRPADAQSGVGNVGNMLMFDTAQRCMAVRDFRAPKSAPPARRKWFSVLLCRVVTLGVRGLWPFSKYPMVA